MISIIHPSRSRPHQSYATICKWVGWAGVPVQVIVSLDLDDIELNKYLELYKGFGDRGHTVMSANNKSAIEAINRAMFEATGNIFVIVSDDTDCPKRWGVKLEIMTKTMRDFVIKTYDGVQNRIITMPIFDRAYYNRFGYVYNPEYDHMFADTEYTDVAHILKRVVTKLSFKFPHRQYSVIGRKPDELNLRNNATMDKGREIYKRRKKIKFGL